MVLVSIIIYKPEDPFGDGEKDWKIKGISETIWQTPKSRKSVRIQRKLEIKERLEVIVFSMSFTRYWREHK